VILAFLVIACGSLFGQASLSAEQLFDRGMELLSGAGPSRRDLDAVDFFRRSARLGYAPAQVVLGYFSDVGVLVPGEHGEAADWYRKASDQGDPLAQWLLGRLYFMGSGVPMDYHEAQRWLQQAAQQGDPFGAYLLGRVMENRDYTQAPRWFRAAAERGLPQAQYRYGRSLKDGRGIPQDRFEAYVWLVVALDAGYQAATDDLTELEGNLTSSQIEQAKAKAAKLEDDVSRSANAHGCTGWEGEFDEIPTPPPPKLQKYCR
jgi:TPR repeat protein